MGKVFNFLTFVSLSSVLISLLSSLEIGLITCILLLSLWIIYQSFQQVRLLQWLKNSYKTNPVTHGTWASIYSSINFLLRKNESQKNRLNNKLMAFKRATEAMEDGILIIDNDNQIIAITPRAEGYLGINQKQDFGSNILNHIRHPSFAEYLLSGSLNETIIVEDLSLDKKALEFKLIPFDSNQKIVLCRDVTKLRKLEIEKKDFVASASHELKTPLTVINGYLETVTEMDVSKAEKKRMLVEMTVQTKLMTNLIDDLLLFSKLEKVKPSNDAEQVNVSLMVNELSELSNKIDKNNHLIKFDIEKNIFITCCGEQLRSAFWNLINNAIIYTKKGGKITIRWLKTKEDEAVFEVRDDGPGIEAHHIDKLTDRFYRVDSARSRERGGTGLGLSIVNEIVQRHGAFLKIESQPNVGSNFIIFFPSLTTDVSKKVK